MSRPSSMAGRGRRRLLGLGAAGIVIVAGTVLAMSAGRVQPADKTSAPAAVAVSIGTVSSGTVPIVLEALGRVQAFNTITLRAQTSGQIRSIGFQDGQDVRRGQVLAQIDPRPLQATLDQDEGTFARDQASLANAESDLRRYIPLAGKGIVSAQQVATQRSLVVQLHGTVAADTAMLDRDRVQLGYTTIAAPIAGVLGLRQVDVGNTVTPADPGGIVILTQMQPITVLFPIPQGTLPDVQQRQAAGGTQGLVVQAWTQDDSRELDEGRLSAFSNQVDATSGTVMLKAVFSNANRRLWPGLAVTARLVLDVRHGAATVPAAALDQGPQGAFVWVVGADGTADPHPVTVKQLLQGVALITGAAPGQQVVIDGQYGLKPGAHVVVQTAPPGATSTAATMRTNQPNRLGISP